MESVFREELPFVIRFVRRFGAQPGDVEDLAQAVFVVLLARPELLSSGARPRSVLYGVTRRVLSDYRRRRKRALRAGLAQPVTPPQQEVWVGRSQARAVLDDALSRLDATRRRALMLYELEGLSIREVADLTDSPLQTTYSRICSARAALRRSLARKDLPIAL